MDDSRISVVVGHDGHAAAGAALAAAAVLAARLHAHLHVVHCVTFADYGVDPDTEEFELQRDRNLQSERSAIAAELDDAGVEWSYHEEAGDPAEALARVAAAVAAAYVVVGATHRGLLPHVTGGSVPKRLLQIQDRPVVVVPQPHH